MSSDSAAPAPAAEDLYETGKRLYLARPGRAGDPSMAAAYFERAAVMGHAPAQRVLGVMCLDGDQVERDQAKGAKWLEAAAEQGDPQACFRLALASALGEGVPKDWSRAYELLSRPMVLPLQEARELRRRLYGELVGLYPELAKALARREAPYRASLGRVQSQLAPPFLDQGRGGGDLAEFRIWLALNLGRLSAEEAFEALAERLDSYYRDRPQGPAAARTPPCP
jgi:hypothetical protein